MTLIQAVVLAVVQGLTEFLPVSSAAHLILVSRLTGWVDHGLAFDTAVHAGTLAAVVVYFRHDLLRMAGSLRPGAPSGDRRLLGALAVATLPALLAGALTAGLVGTYLRSPLVIAGTTLFFAVLLWLADRFTPKSLDVPAIGWKKALWIGLAQVLALVPGTSRSGITITAGLALGLTREAAARFSFLLSIPIIAAAGAWGFLQAWRAGEAMDLALFTLGALLAAIVAWLTIAAFLAWVRRAGLTPFVIYRLVLGSLLLVWFWPSGS